MFRFLVEEKIKCLATEKVKYTQRVDYIMQLPVPMDAALNKGSVRPQQGLGTNGSPDLQLEHSGAGVNPSCSLSALLSWDTRDMRCVWWALVGVGRRE